MMKFNAYSRPRRAARGFTLIEVMIVVAIIGILAAIAYPSYTESVRRGRRADVQKALLEAAQFMQRYYAGHNTFVSDVAGATDLVLPNGLNRSPSDAGSTKAYDLTVTDSTGQGYQLNAVPTGPMNGDRCGTFTLTSTNVRGVSGNGASVAQCWK